MCSPRPVYRLLVSVLALLLLLAFTQSSKGQSETQQSLSSTPSVSINSESSLNDTKIIWIEHPIVDDRLVLEVIVESDVEIGKVTFSRWVHESFQFVEIGTVYSPPYQVEMDTSFFNGYLEIRSGVYDLSENHLAFKYVWIYKEKPENYSFLALVFRPVGEPPRR